MRRVVPAFAVVLIAFSVGLASALFLLPFWISPFLSAAEKGNPADWIGFAGNISAGAMTLIAAAFAWTAVQKQIAIQQEIATQQTAIQQFAILQGTLAFLQEEQRFNDEIKLQGQYTTITENSLQTTPLQLFKVTSTRTFLEERTKDINALGEEFERAGKNRWAFVESGRTRQRVRGLLTKLNLGSMAAAQELRGIEFRSQSTGIVSPADDKIAKAINLATERADIASVCGEFGSLLTDEILPISAIMKDVRSRAGV